MKFNIELNLSDKVVEELKDCTIELSFLQPFKYLSIPLKEEGKYNISVNSIEDKYLVKTEKKIYI